MMKAFGCRPTKIRIPFDYWTVLAPHGDLTEENCVLSDVSLFTRQARREYCLQDLINFGLIPGNINSIQDYRLATSIVWGAL